MPFLSVYRYAAIFPAAESADILSLSATWHPSFSVLMCGTYLQFYKKSRGWKGNAGKERMEKPLSRYNHSRLEGSITAPGRERKA